MRALSIAIVAGALIAPAARAEVTAGRRELIASVLPDLPAWWAEFGRPGWVASSWLGVSGPWVLAGHARGGWALAEPGRAPSSLPEPAPGSADTPLASYDSVVVRIGEGGAWNGFNGTLATATGLPAPRVRRAPESVVDLGSGDLGFDGNGLMVDRVDSLTWLRGEALGTTRGPFGSTDLAGRHRWGVSAGARRGRHDVEGTFAQRGVAARLISEDEESNASASGSVRYRYRRNGWQASLAGARGYAHHESFGSLLLTSKRDADASVATGELRHDSGLEARIEARRERVSRTESEEFQARTSQAWAVLGLRRPWADGELALAVGGGRLGATREWQLAPEIHYRAGFPGGRAHIGAERVLHAAWGDLAPGQAPFVQSTWVGVAELEVGARPRFARVSMLAGRTHDRALVARVPLTDVGLRVGQTRDPDPYDFGLLWAEVEVPWRRFRVGGEGFGLVRRDGPTQPRVDPGYGYRAWGEVGFRAFRGDLGLVLRAGLEGVGERSSEFDRDVLMAGYATSAVQIQLSMGSAFVTIRARNLEDERHEEPWLDDVAGAQALGPGRELRFVTTLVLGN